MKVELLESVWCVLIEGVTYPATVDGGYDKEMDFPLNEIEDLEWWDSLSPEDLKICKKELKKLEVSFPCKK